MTIKDYPNAQRLRYKLFGAQKISKALVGNEGGSDVEVHTLECGNDGRI